MIEEQARVVALEEQGVWVETQRRSACGNCSVNNSCGTALLGKVLGVKRNKVFTLNPESKSVAVGDEVGRCHGTIAYHFGTSEELQAALMKSMVAELAEELDNTLSGPGQPKNRPEHLANAIFDAFEEGGAGVLMAWIALSNKKRRLKPVREPVKRLVRRVSGGLVPGKRQTSRQTKDMILFLMLCAMADSLIGPDICAMLGEGNGAMRKLALRLIPHFLKSNG